MNRIIHSKVWRTTQAASLAGAVMLLLAIAAGRLDRAEAKPPGKGRLPRITLFVSGSATNAGDVATFGVYLLNNDSINPINVHYSTGDGWATVADGDYLPTSGTLTFAPGETYKTVAVQTLPDLYPEYDEEFYLWAATFKPDGSVWVTDVDSCTIYGELGPIEEDPSWGDSGEPSISP